MCNMADTAYKPVPHDAAFRKALLAKPGVKKAFDALEEEYTALHTMLEARQTAGLTQADVANRMGTTQRKALAVFCNPAQIRASVWQEIDYSNGLSATFFVVPHTYPTGARA